MKEAILALIDNKDLDLFKARDFVETVFIEMALKRASGNHSEAARLLKVNRTTLLDKISRFDVGRDDELDNLERQASDVIRQLEETEVKRKALIALSLHLEHQIDDLKAKNGKPLQCVNG